MTNGIVVCAHNNELFRYTDLIPNLTDRAARHLGISKITIITDSDSAKHIDTTCADHIIKVDRGTNSTRSYQNTWFSTQAEFVNASRLEVYDLSPYDQTLVLDLDLVICDNKLSKVWNSIPFQINTRFGSIFQPDAHNYRTISSRYKGSDHHVNISIPSWNCDTLNDVSINTAWATAFAFNRDPLVEHLFALTKHVRKNYDYFAKLYRLKGNLIRNDYCFAIAIHLLGGYQADSITSLPTIIHYAFEDTKVSQIIEDRIDFVNGDKVLTARNMDFHVMNKPSLMKALGL